jgi:CheY-like chemotaxis protein
MNKRALVVDDDPMIRTLVQGMLQDEGFEVVLAEDGQKGLDVLANEPRPIQFDLIVMDVMMPNMTGLEALAELKQDNDSSTIPVIMLTAESKPEDIMNGYSHGAEYYITKPFTREQLLYGLQLVLG